MEGFEKAEGGGVGVVYVACGVDKQISLGAFGVEGFYAVEEGLVDMGLLGEFGVGFFGTLFEDVNARHIIFSPACAAKKRHEQVRDESAQKASKPQWPKVIGGMQIEVKFRG